MANKERRVRRVAFTINNYTQEELTQLHMCFEEKNFLYIIGKEIGKSGTPHLQGYFETKNPIRFDTIKKIMPRAHIEAARGNKRENYKYCSKDGNFISNIEIEEKDNYKLNDYLNHLKGAHALLYDRVIDWRLYEDYNTGILDKINGKGKYAEDCELADSICKKCIICAVEITNKINEKLNEE